MENFKPIIDAYHPILYKIGRSFTRYPVDFEDLYQEMLIQIYQSLKNFRGEAKLSTWLYRVALNTAMTYSRNNKKMKQEVHTSDFSGLSAQRCAGTWHSSLRFFAVNGYLPGVNLFLRIKTEG